MRVQRLQNGDGCLQGIDAGVGNGGMRHLAVDGHFHLQAAVVRGYHGIRKAGGNQQVGFDNAALKQPAGAEFAAKLFVVSEMQLDRALQLRRIFRR